MEMEEGTKPASSGGKEKAADSLLSLEHRGNTARAADDQQVRQ